MIRLSLATSIAALALSTAALAQDAGSDLDFDGPYIGLSGGYTTQADDGGSSILFDTNRDGTFGENVNTVAGANAFSPGFCGGAATSTANTNCTNDNDDFEYFARLGYDRRFGNFVVGAVLEGGRSEATDSVSAFSTTPASYTISREADYTLGARLRAGYTPGGGILFYATGGGAYARLDNSFSTSNGANAFADNGKTNGWGYAVGGGAEAMITSNISLGLEYLFTDIDDDDFNVQVTQGTAPATNPFLLNGGGTAFQRSDTHFRTHAFRASVNYRF